MCTCMLTYVLVLMCVGMYTCLQACLWGPKDIVRDLPPWIYLAHCRGASQSNPELSGKAGLNSQFVLEILCLRCLRLEL